MMDRCQSQERRLTLFIRTTEGEFGDLLVTVVTGQTPKSAKVNSTSLRFGSCANIERLKDYSSSHEAAIVAFSSPRSYGRRAQ